MREVTVVGGGLAGLVAAIACAQEGLDVRLYEAHETLGGRARSEDGDFKVNLGPHAMFSDGPFWKWLHENGVLPERVSPPLVGGRFRAGGELRRTPPLSSLPSILRLRGREAPVDRSFRDWACEHVEAPVAEMLGSAAGVYAFHHDPGSFSAQFIWERSRRILLDMPTPVRYVVGGWSRLVETLERGARERGVKIETASPVDALPGGVVILATELDQASALLGQRLTTTSGNAVCIDLGLESARTDPAYVSDLDEAGWASRYSKAEPSLAPGGHDIVQAQIGIRPGESTDAAALRLEALLDLGFPAWRERTRFKRRQVMRERTGALDEPGRTWRDRPAIDRGDGVFIAGDKVAAPGLLAEVSWASAIAAAQGAGALLAGTSLRSAA
jgi:phytoene dehydrogenase-like protein